MDFLSDAGGWFGGRVYMLGKHTDRGDQIS